MTFSSDRGDAIVELAIVTPALMLLIVGLLQLGLWHHAKSVVQTAAMEGAREAAADGASAEDGRNRSIEVLSVGLGSAARSPAVRVEKGSELTLVEIDAEMPGLLPIPGLSSIALRGASSSLTERFRPAEGTS